MIDTQTLINWFGLIDGYFIFEGLNQGSELLIMLKIKVILDDDLNVKNKKN